jgi:hypothetical protein
MKNTQITENSRGVYSLEGIHRGGGRYKIIIKAISKKTGSEQIYITKNTYGKKEASTLIAEGRFGQLMANCQKWEG